MILFKEETVDSTGSHCSGFDNAEPLDNLDTFDGVKEKICTVLSTFLRFFTISNEIGNHVESSSSLVGLA